ncbi:MAG: arginine--tRNA ligase [Lachnospiraceae bacterium]|nr:arginine--tRNA ligase [Lachnospiraceae bacterium]
MKTLLQLLSEEAGKAFAKAGYDEKYAKVSLSNRPDLCEFQCNGALAAAKEYKKAPIMIAGDVTSALEGSACFAKVEAVAPGFLNLTVAPAYLCSYMQEMAESERFGYTPSVTDKRIIVDYGGPNVAKPLHIGHLRAAIIGESVKRICKYAGNDVIGDIHLGDWGLQMGLIITELKNRKPDLPYFDDSFTGEYPKEAPFTISELEEIYPCASAKSKEDDAYKEAALTATFELQHGKPGYMAIWKHIMNISVADLKRNYENLNVHFEWWKGESDVQPLIPGMVSELKESGLAHESEGALVVDVAEETDTKEIPPCMILKSDGASLYATTDLATLKDRRSTFDPDQVIYVVDKRQEMHFVQVFRTARKAGIVREDTKLDFLGFGTMNGADGKPFKTRDGGVMRLETLISDINEQMYKKITENHETDPEEARKTAKIVALSAIKYGDLSNQATKDYVFDSDKFTSFEGNTGPYILYTIVRIKSILKKYFEGAGSAASGAVAAGAAAPGALALRASTNETDKSLMLELVKFSDVMEAAYTEIAPHKICAYIYDVANAFNRFYHENKILTESDSEKQQGWIALLSFTLKVLETCIDLLGFGAPEKM